MLARTTTDQPWGQEEGGIVNKEGRGNVKRREEEMLRREERRKEVSV